jgi:hypothetical protein
MTERIFVAMSSKRMAAEIRQAHQRVLLATPGIHEEVAQALCVTVDRLGQEKVDVVLDCTEEMCRLGYGDIGAIKLLAQKGIEVRQGPGLRVGVLICDDRAWSFAPTALCVEEETQWDEHPNAVRLSREQAHMLAKAICPPTEQVQSAAQDDATPQEGKPTAPEISPRPQEEAPQEPEIGRRPMNELEIKRMEKGLEAAPPLKFDVARQVRVFQPYIQYVAVNLKGCSISRRQVQIPQYLLNLTDDKELESRLRTTFNVIDKTSSVSDSALKQELRLILEDFTSSLGEPYGRILLRAKRPEFDARVKALNEKVEIHKKTIKDKLQKEIENSIDRIVEAWVVHVLTSPPPQLRKQVVGDPTDEKAVQWLCDELHKVFPDAEELISEMRLNVHFRDVTYETLKDKDFEKGLKKAFPYVDWDKPFKEFDAAKLKEEAQTEGAK